MRIFLASDHAGFRLKEKLRTFLMDLGYEVKDSGAFSYDEKDDYPDFVRKAAMAVADDPETSRAIILGGSGQGEAMVANRFKGVRAVVYYGEPSVAACSAELASATKAGKAMEGESKAFNIIKLSREHNNANVLSLGARFLDEEEVKKAVRLWLETNFNAEGENARHLRRIKKIDSN